MILPLTGAIVAAVRAFGRRHTDAQSQDMTRTRPPDPPAPDGAGVNQAAQWRSVRRVLDEHGRTDARWLEYELDVTKLLDFPLMTDMRDPHTIAFHKAKLRADFLRPIQAEDLLDDREGAAQYMAAVEDYVTAFNAAEAEAIRRRRNDFSARISSELRGRRICYESRPTPGRRRMNASAHTTWPATNSTACWCCHPRHRQTSSAESPASWSDSPPSA